MKIVSFNNTDDLNLSVSKEIGSYFIGTRRINIALFSGSTSIPIYFLLSEQSKNVNFDNIHFYTHNEVPLVPYERGGIVGNHINTYFFSQINIVINNIHLINSANFSLLEEEIEHYGGMDLIILSVGEDGHIAANYPNLDTFSGIRKINLTPNQDLYKTLLENEKKHELVTSHYYSFGIDMIMQAKNIIIVAYGDNKKYLLDKIKFGEITPQHPVTLLANHPACKWFTVSNEK
jgi:6-phosphogluconolactonase/glucosamine-6-phosphate isomerase/deaminase